MNSKVQLREDIMKHINLASESRLNQIDMFVRFLFYEPKENKIHLLEIEKKEDLEKDFFSICGIWEDKELDANTLRKEAWRTPKW